MVDRTSDSYNCATCLLALASPNAPCPRCLRETGNPWPHLENPLVDLVDKPGLGAAMRHAIEQATIARTSNERIRSKCEHGVYGLMPDACGRCLVADRDRLRTALQACLDELLTLNKGIGWRDGEWSSIKMAREALAGCGSHETCECGSTEFARSPEGRSCFKCGRPAQKAKVQHCVCGEAVIPDGELRVEVGTTTHRLAGPCFQTPPESEPEQR